MKTMSGNAHGPRLGLLYVGLALTLAASLALEGTVLRLELDPAAAHMAAAPLTVLAAATLVCLLSVAVLGIAVLRAGRAHAPPARKPAGPDPRDADEAAALAHSQKMEALGLLAGGVAHDFNNVLHVIRNSLDVLQRHGPRADAGRCLEIIRHSTERGAALTRQLLAFSRRQPLEPAPIDPNDLVSGVAELLRHSLGELITVETILGAEVGNVAADAGQLETALLNLAINARDAMAHAGLLTIETANAMLDAAADAYVMISVSDTGTGMTAEVAARACEPFFTTKERGHGTGLGLSQVAGFARQSGGQVRIASEPGKGTTVRLYLPRSALAAGAPAGGSAPAWSIKEATRGLPLAAGAGQER